MEPLHSFKGLFQLLKFHIIAFTHRNLGLEKVGKLHIEPDQLKNRLGPVQQKFGFEEFLFLSTCNRVEFLFRGNQATGSSHSREILAELYPALEASDIEHLLEKATILHGIDAIRHLFFVASSMDSLVLGEREIITQVRQAFENCNKLGFTGDNIRLVIQKTIETAKQVYSETAISKKPVSVVNLAYKRLLDLGLNASDRILIIGAGQTNEAMLGNLSKHQLNDVTLFNRTLEKAERLASRYGYQAEPLEALTQYKGRPDVIITCTGASTPVITPEIYKTLSAKGEPRIIVDLAIPNDLSPELESIISTAYIQVETLKEEARKNLKEREKELFRCEEIVEKRLEEFALAYKTRQLERAMNVVPQMIREIREQAVQNKFSGKIGQMSTKDQETLTEVLDYLEKKYMAIPMRMAKEVVLNMDIKDKIIG